MSDTPTFTLTPPKPVEAVSQEQAEDSVVQVVLPDQRTAIEKKADAQIASLVKKGSNSPEFKQAVMDFVKIGAKEQESSSSTVSRLMRRPAMSPKKGDGTTPVQVATTLGDLRQVITELDPKRSDLTGVKSLLKFIPGSARRAIEGYFRRYESAQDQLDAIVRSLLSGQDELREDNAALQIERQGLWDSMQSLGEAKVYVQALTSAVEAEIAKAREEGRADDAQRLEADALFALNQRHQDIMTHMATIVQGYLAMDVVQGNNNELIKGVDRARTTTISALRVAVVISQALGQQKIVLDQTKALNASTSDILLDSSERLKQQGAEINEQAASATLDLSKLESAFQNVFETLDAIDTFRAEANHTMTQTVQALEQQVMASKGYLERSRSKEE